MAHSCSHDCDCNHGSNSEKEELLNYLSNEINSIAEQIRILDSNILQLTNAIESAAALKDSNDEDMLIPLANGIFYKTKTMKNDSLLVNVGSDVFVNKSVKDLDVLLKQQIDALKKNREALMGQYNSSMAILQQAQSNQ